MATARPGMTERELAWAIEVFLHEHGASGLGVFETIVGAGENGASPHHETLSDRVIRANEPSRHRHGRALSADTRRTATFSLGISPRT
ncbi:MAG: M24 family metallopeptidase [Anaerolineae bacterium]